MKFNKLQSLNNFLDHLKKDNPELNNLFFYGAEVYKRWALASKGEHGSIDIKTAFLNYEEMNQFLNGYMFKAQNRFKK